MALPTRLAHYDALIDVLVDALLRELEDDACSGEARPALVIVERVVAEPIAESKENPQALTGAAGSTRGRNHGQHTEKAAGSPLPMPDLPPLF